MSNVPLRSSIELTFREVQGSSRETTVPAGVVTDWIDKTAYACAASWTKAFCVTAYVGNMHFRVPVPRDTPITVQARVVHTGGTSVHIQTRLLIASDEGEPIVCTECYMIYVALGEDGEPEPVPVFTPETDLQKRRNVDATRRAKNRRRIEDAIFAMPEASGTSESVRLRFVVDTDDRYPDGKIRGGAVMRWIDQAAEICAERYCGEHVTGVLTGGVRFYRPVTVGDLVEVEARLVLTGEKSMHVMVRVRGSKRWEKTSHVVAYGLPVMVAPNSDGGAQRVVPWQPLTEVDHGVAEQARLIRQLRQSSLPSAAT